MSPFHAYWPEAHWEHDSSQVSQLWWPQKTQHLFHRVAELWLT